MSVDTETDEAVLRRVRTLLQRRQSLAEQLALALAHGHSEVVDELQSLLQLVEERVLEAAPTTWRCCYPNWMLLDGEGGPEAEDPQACWICLRPKG